MGNNIMTVFNNISNSFYSSLNNIGTNPLVLVVLIIVIIIYYVLFSFLGVNKYDDDDDDGIFGSGSYVIIEGLLWGIFIILIFVNGLAYFFNINLVTEFQNIFSQKPEINISTTNDFKSSIDSSSLSSSLNEVFHIPGRTFTYHDSKAVCKAFDREIADYNQL